MATIKDSATEFSRFPADLVGKIDSVSVSPDEAWMNLIAARGGTTTITLYSDANHPGLLTPRDGMWRGALLSLAQRALTHQHKVTVSTVQLRLQGIHVWVALGMTLHKGGV